jgi:Ser/Thr protein kinase RdoA (MazF antagonist)
MELSEHRTEPSAPPDVVPAAYTLLSGAALEERVLRHYDLGTGGAAVTCRLLHPGDNDHYLVNAGSRSFVLRVYRAYKPRAAVEAEAQLLAGLAERGIPVVRPIRRADGGYVQELPALEGTRCAVLFEHVEGRPPGAEITREQTYVCGNILASIHTAADEMRWHMPGRRLDLDGLLDEPLRLIAPLLERRPADLGYLRDTVGWLKGKLGGLPRAMPEFGLCHGDLHKRNVLADGRGRVVVMDWDFGGDGWRAYDLAVMRWSLGPVVGPGGLPGAEDLYAWYLEGYSSVRPLGDDEVRAIPYFVVARQIWITGSVTRHVLAGDLGYEDVDDAALDRTLRIIRGWIAGHCAA